MEHTALVVRALVVPAIGLGLLQSALAADRFQGTFSSGAHVIRIHQVGSRVCGEWNEDTDRSVREGLVAGVVSNGELTLTECEDYSLSCKPMEKAVGASPTRLILGKGNLEILRGNGDGSNWVFRRSSRTLPKWVNLQAGENAQFLSRCMW